MGLFTKENPYMKQYYDQLTGLGQQMQGLQTPGFGQARNMLGQAGDIYGSGSQPSMDYYQNLLSGQGLDPYAAGSPYQNYQKSALQNFQTNVMPQVASQASASGLLRGSTAANTTESAMNQLTNQLQQQAYGDYQTGRQMQYGAAGNLGNMLFGQAQGLAGLGGQYGNLAQQQYGNELAKLQGLGGLYGQQAQAGLQVQQPTGFSKFLGALLGMGGQTIGAAGQAGGFGNLFSFGQQPQRYPQGYGNASIH